jgi:hypothetical protein
MSDKIWPAAGSERREDHPRSGTGTLTSPDGRARRDRAAEVGPVTQEPRRGRQARPVPSPRPAAGQRNQRVAPQAAAERLAGAATAQPAGTGQRAGTGRFAGARTRPETGAPWRVPPARRTAGPRPAGPRAPQAEPAQRTGTQGTGTQAQAPQPGALVAPHRMPFMLLLCGLLGGALISALVISTTLAEGSFKISKLQDSTSALARQRQALEDQVAQAQSAQVIEERAAKLGMRRTSELMFVNLKTGKVTDTGPTWDGAVSAPGYAP